jgi:hypothetical protein
MRGDENKGGNFYLAMSSQEWHGTAEVFLSALLSQARRP